MNLAKLIIKTIQDEANETRKLISAARNEILESIKQDGGKTYLEQDAGDALSLVMDKINPCQVEVATAVVPSITYDDRDMDDWVRANFHAITEMIKMARAGITAKRVAEHLNLKLGEDKYNHQKIYQVKSILRTRGYIEGNDMLTHATDKLRALRP